MSPNNSTRIFTLLLSTPSLCFAEWRMNMSPGVTDTSASIYDLHMIVFYICLAISVVVFGIMFWSIFHHKKSKGAIAHSFHESTKIELLWTIIPTIILVIILFPSTKALVASYDTSESDVDIQITGYQWKWRYKYVGEDIDFFSIMATPRDEINNKKEKNPNYLLEVDNPLVIPINKKIRFLLTSNDVIHSWWVPALALKKDAIPGFINDAFTKINTPGIYRGQCAELCGKDHGFMPIVVKAVTEEEYAIWVAQQKELKIQAASASQKEWSKEELMEKGEKVYAKACAACHQPTGLGLPPMFPALKGSPVALGPIEKHLHIVLQGKTGTTMAAFKDQLSAVDISAVITYERNAWGNNKGDYLSPARVIEIKGNNK